MIIIHKKVFALIQLLEKLILNIIRDKMKQVVLVQLVKVNRAPIIKQVILS